MIETFGNVLAEDLFEDRHSRVARSFPTELRRAARRELLYLDEAADLGDLRSPPGSRLERLKGDLKGFHAIRINDQWRIVFRWSSSSALDVQILDDH